MVKNPVAAAIHQESLDDITTGQVPFQALNVWILFCFEQKNGSMLESDRDLETKMPQNQMWISVEVFFWKASKNCSKKKHVGWIWWNEKSTGPLLSAWYFIQDTKLIKSHGSYQQVSGEGCGLGVEDVHH